jgi:asparagine synthase (glutamine-hydrolysing)
MCGIVGVFDLKINYLDLRTSVLKMSKKLRHRGPDWSGIFYCEKAIMRLILQFRKDLMPYGM